MLPTLYVRPLALGEMKNFVFLVGLAGEKEVTVIDPAWDVLAIERAAAQDGKVIHSAIATHHHRDHTNGLVELLSRHDVPVYAQRAEVDFADNLRELGDAVRPVAPGQVLQVGRLAMTAIHTPGHTPGSQSLLAGDALFSGDTLFVNACGRCDFRGGDPEALYRSLTQTLDKLPADTRLFPGHDYGDVPVSSLGREREHNPYFQLPDLAAFIAHRMLPRA